MDWLDKAESSGKSLSPLGTTCLEDNLPGFSTHTNTKSVTAFTFNIARLICALHDLNCLCPSYTRKKLVILRSSTSNCQFDVAFFVNFDVD